MLNLKFNDYPIYDSFVGKVFYIARDAKTIDEKIEQDLFIIKTLSETYNTIKCENLLSDEIGEFNSLFPNRISFEKKIDFMLWAIGLKLTKKTK